MILKPMAAAAFAACTCTGAEQSTSDLCPACKILVLTEQPHAALVRRITNMVEMDERMKELGPWSTGEKLAVCLVLNRHDWLTAIGYTMLEAVDRLGAEWTAAALAVEKARR